MKTNKQLPTKQTSHIKLTIQQQELPSKHGVRLKCSGKGGTPCSTNDTHRVILVYDVLLLSNSRFGYYRHLIYPNELDVNDTTATQESLSYLEIYNKRKI